MKTRGLQNTHDVYFFYHLRHGAIFQLILALVILNHVSPANINLRPSCGWASEYSYIYSFTHYPGVIFLEAREIPSH